MLKCGKIMSLYSHIPKRVDSCISSVYGKILTSDGCGLLRLFPEEVPERTQGVATRGFGP